MTTKLSAGALAEISRTAAVPAYKAADLSPGIVHFGIGNFHRAHQAVYLDDLFNLGESHDWALVGAGVFEGEKKGRAAREAQDWLTTVVEQDEGHMAARVTGSMVDFVTPGDAAAIIDRLAAPDIRIVSMTITEGGYFIDPASGHFNPAHPEIVAGAQNITAPKTVFGLILAGLMRRRADGIVPFTVMSCDNIPHNGRVTAEAIGGLAELVDEDLAVWVRDNVAFPNSMVDRITPATSDRERKILADEFGVPVTSSRAQNERAGIVVLQPPADQLTVLTASLHNHGVTVTTRQGCVRLSAHVTTSEETFEMLRSSFMSYASAVSA